jgi:acyl carrier protein
MRVDWKRWRGLGVTGRVSPRFAHLLHQHEATERAEPQQGLPTFEAVRTAAVEDRRALLDRLIRDKVARVLGTTPDRLSADKPLLNLGIDSLMGVELRNWIEQELRMSLPIMELMRSPSLSHLTDALLELLANEAASNRTEPELVPREPSFAAADLLDRIEDLPGEDVDALLTALLAEKQAERSTTP